MIADEAIRNDRHVVYRSCDLHEGAIQPIRLLGEDLVRWRSGAVAMAWLDLCIHRGSRFSMGRVHNGEMVCPYHGWRYNREGRCTLIPSQPDEPIPTRARAITYRCRESYGFVWVCMGEPAADLPLHPEWEDADYDKVHTGPYEFESSGPRVVENVLDVTHFPFVHDAMLGQEGDPDAIGEYEVQQSADGLRTGPVHVFQPVGDHRRVPVQSTYTFWCPRPLMPYLKKDLGERRRFSHFMPVTPVEDDRSLLWVLTSANYDKDGAEARITARNNEIFGQDQPIVNGQRPVLIPEEVRRELHVRADRLSVLYRRWLHGIGVTGALD